MEQIKKAVIEIASITSNDDKALKIKDSNNLAYTIWKVKQDMTETKSWSALKSVPWFGMWQKFAVSFKEENKTYMNRPYIARTIIIIEPAGNASVSSPPAQQMQTFAPNWMQKQSKNDDNAEWKVRHWFALEAYKLWLELDKSLADNIDRWVKYVLNWTLPDPIIEQITDAFWWDEVIDDGDSPF